MKYTFKFIILLTTIFLLSCKPMADQTANEASFTETKQHNQTPLNLSWDDKFARVMKKFKSALSTYMKTSAYTSEPSSDEVKDFNILVKLCYERSAEEILDMIKRGQFSVFKERIKNRLDISIEDLEETADTSLKLTGDSTIQNKVPDSEGESEEEEEDKSIEGENAIKKITKSKKEKIYRDSAIALVVLGSAGILQVNSKGSSRYSKKTSFNPAVNKMTDIKDIHGNQKARMLSMAAFGISTIGFIVIGSMIIDKEKPSDDYKKAMEAILISGGSIGIAAGVLTIIHPKKLSKQSPEFQSRYTKRSNLVNRFMGNNFSDPDKDFKKSGRISGFMGAVLSSAFVVWGTQLNLQGSSNNPSFEVSHAVRNAFLEFANLEETYSAKTK